MDSMEIDDDIYINKNLTMEGLVTKVNFQRGKQPSRCVTVCLGLLCAVLLAGNIGQFIYYEKISRPASADPTQASYNIQGEHLQSCHDAFTAERGQLEDRLTNLTKEKDQLQQSYNTLKQESDQLRTNHNNLTAGKDQLQTSYINLQTEKDQLQQSYISVTTERDKFKASFNNLKNEKDQLQASYNTLKQQSDQLQTNYNNLAASKNQLETKFRTLQREKDQLKGLCAMLTINRDQLQSNYSSLKRNKDQLQRSYNTLSTSKDQLQISYSSSLKDKEQMQSSYKTLQTEKQQLQTNYSNLATIRDQLQKKIDKVREKKNWTLSRGACFKEGADLVVIDNREEQEFINGVLKSDENAWIGLTDSLEEGTWTWVDGTPVTTTYWQPGQPNSFNGNQDCGEIVQKSAGVGQWNDDGCFSNQKWICEK
ncbi:C-type lectin domain family 4 member M-like isoform X2 [Plectropomus leopardus]|uniref:C-type lectin domain family 4 member M-like isoform X2 n=1 Tax=Plectropomus leopardus TaxID=160734 RepID=UPI001C4C5F89|nr:C-type lectin domain family 4 member M-like isoform X2 [Plectropomus leopardus]